jgi:16S rRNA (guanine527-N7)-methyltransferase
VKHLPPDRLKAVAAYEEMLLEWAPRFDLISDADVGRVRERHIEDSLRVVPFIADLPPGWGVDVGSGAGLPGIPLAIATDRPWRLLEPRRKRAAFLEEVVRELSLTECEVVARSAEEAATDPTLAAGHVVSTARALAPPSRTLELCLPLVRPGGHVLIFLGRSAETPPEAEEIEPGIISIQRDAG